MSTRNIFISLLAIAVANVAAAQDAPASADAAKAPKAAASKAPAAVGPFTVAPHWSKYDYPKSVPEGKAYHMVVKGDTLWDIAGKYLGDPFLWPQVWEANGYIKTARLIYPGDPVLLPVVQVADAPGAAPASEVAAPAEAEEAAPKAAMAPPAPPEWTNMDALISVASPDSVRYAGYLSASVEDETLKVKGMEGESGSAIEKLSAGTRDVILLNRGANGGVKAGDLFTLNRRARVVRNPATGKRVGYRIDTSGVARVVMVGESSARAVVESAGREVLVGDYLRPYTEPESPLVKRRVVVEGGNLSLDGTQNAGYVVDIDDASSVSATGVTIGLDLGSSAGVAVGKVVTVFRQANRADNVTRRALGAAVVVAVRENFSVARLVYSREEILVGDRVVLQP